MIHIKHINQRLKKENKEINLGSDSTYISYKSYIFDKSYNLSYISLIFPIYLYFVDKIGDAKKIDRFPDKQLSIIRELAYQHI